MGAATPIWVTLLVAALSPVLTLLGVIWTQRRADVRAAADAERADRRALREAELRLEAQREAALSDQKLQVYSDVMLFMSRDRSNEKRSLDTPEGLEAFQRDSQEFRKLLVQVQFLGSESVELAIFNLWSQIIWVDSYQLHPERESFDPEEIEKARKGIREMEKALRYAIRDDLGVPQKIEREEVEATIGKGPPFGS